MAWVEPGADPSLVVHDTVTRHELASIPVEAGHSARSRSTRPGSTTTRTGRPGRGSCPDFEPGAGARRRLPRRRRVRARPHRGARLRRADGSRCWRRATSSSRGRAPCSRPDADYLLTHLDLATSPSVVRIYDVETGEPVAERRSTTTSIALAAAFGPDNTITYVVGAARARHRRRRAAPSLRAPPALELRTCDAPVRRSARPILQSANEFDGSRSLRRATEWVSCGQRRRASPVEPVEATTRSAVVVAVLSYAVLDRGGRRR